MNASQDYHENGYTRIEGIIPNEVAMGFLAKLKTDFARGGVSFNSLLKESPLLKQKAVEIYGYHYAPMITFLWGMTPYISLVVGRKLLPTYCYFRIYREGDILRVHSDRPSCEHSVSLLMATSDGLDWPFDIGKAHVTTPREMADESFGDTPFSSLHLNPGDAVLYQGVHRHHGRTLPNPNRWSAHLFLHWIDADGPYAASAFDGQRPPTSIDF